MSNQFQSISYRNKYKEFVGAGEIDNTPYTTKQITFAIALSNHPLVHEIIKRKDIEPKNFDGEMLVNNKILKGLKILDLGCGIRPVFARVARYLGADVYTVNVESSADFDFKSENFLEEYRGLEIDHHLQIDLNEEDAAKKILDLTNGGFDLVTEAQLKRISPITRPYKDESFFSFSRGHNIARDLLKLDGVYYNANEIFEGEPSFIK